MPTYNLFIQVNYYLLLLSLFNERKKYVGIKQIVIKYEVIDT